MLKNLRKNYKFFKPSLLLFFLFTLVNSQFVSAQKVVHGSVIDSESGNPLPAANIIIEGTYRGTITNEEGRFSLKILQLPATLKVTYIGYISEKREIYFNSDAEQIFELKPTVFEFGPIVVTAEDPAIAIMREVIKRKQIWRKKLLSYKAKAFTRQRLENDTSIVSITESISEAFWDKNKGAREVIKSKRQTSNVKEQENFAGASYVSNFYDDDIEIQGHKTIGPTHPKALNYYNFKLENQRVLDDKIVFDILVSPSTKLQPAFEGQLAVLDEEFAMIEVDLKPGAAFIFPPPIKEWNVYYKQQFRNFGKDFWLPVDVRINGDIKVGFPGLNFPTFKYHQTSKLTDYLVNVVLPDSIFKEKRLLLVDSLSIKQDNDSLFASNPEVVPLSTGEEEAYSVIDSTHTFAKAFKPTGPLARFVDMEEDEETDNNKSSNRFFPFNPHLSYNRVDGGHLGLSFDRRIHKNVRWKIAGGYKTHLKEWGYQADLNIRWGKRRRGWLELSYFDNTETRYRSDNFSRQMAATLALFGYHDYYDYYWMKGFQSQLGYRIRKLDLSLSAELRAEEHSSRTNITSKGLIRRKGGQRPNPAIQEGNLRSIGINLVFGDEYTPFGVVGQNRAEFSAEYSPSSFLSNEFDFTRYQFSLNARIPTFFKRRLMPNTLELRIVGGTFTGSLPVQRFGILDVSLGAFSPFGTFKSLRGFPLDGEKYLAVFWEHNFRTIPFEILGLRSLAKRDLGIIIHGASGRTWIDPARLSSLTYAPRYQDSFRHEIGLSLNGLFGMIRLDYTRRLDKAGDYLGFGFKRFF